MKISRTTNRRVLADGFTLIELLVVVAIIALLISILLPSLSLARKQAKQMICNTRLRAQGQASYLYAEDNKDTIVRGEALRRRDGQNLHFATTLLQGLGYDGQIRSLWRPVGRNRDYHLLLAKIKTLQCPSFPIPEQVLDFVVNAFPIPYTDDNIRSDRQGGGQRGERRRGEGNYDNQVWFRLTSFTGRAKSARLVHITEAHTSLDTDDNQILHDLFYTSQLPFGAFPRISNDKRHPGGVNALFFDGHAQTMSFPQFDVGWPHRLGLRLQWFTIMADGDDR